MPHTSKQERYFRAKGISFLPNATESNIRKSFAKRFGVTPNKIQIDKKRGTQMTYIVTVFKHKKPIITIGNRSFIIS